MIKSHCFVFCCSCYLYKTRTFGPCDVHASNTWNLRWTLKKNRVLDELQWNKTVFAFPKVCFTLFHNGDEASFDLFSLFRGCWGCNTDQHWPAQCVASECLQKTAWMRLSSTNHSLLACRPWMMNMMNQQKIVVFPHILKNCSEEGLQYMRPGCCYHCPKICNLEARELGQLLENAQPFWVPLENGSHVFRWFNRIGGVSHCQCAAVQQGTRTGCVPSWYPSWKISGHILCENLNETTNQMISRWYRCRPGLGVKLYREDQAACRSWEVAKKEKRAVVQWLGYNLPSGKHRKSYWKWPSRNSWFTS